VPDRRTIVAVGTTITDRPPQSGRTVARSGLRMMPTFPLSPLSFRTAGFPQYGWKAGISDSAFPEHPSLKPAPGIRRLYAWFASALRAPHSQIRLSRSVPGRRLLDAPPWSGGPTPPLSLLDITTTVTGVFCRWDFHPLEWQLSSLHQIRTSASTHTALTKDEWRRSVHRDRGAERGVEESTGSRLGSNVPNTSVRADCGGPEHSAIACTCEV
jgi:hypothetical protein